MILQECIGVQTGKRLRSKPDQTRPNTVKVGTHDMLQYGERQVLQCSGRVATADARTMKENETLYCQYARKYLYIYLSIHPVGNKQPSVSIAVWYETVTAAIAP